MWRNLLPVVLISAAEPTGVSLEPGKWKVAFVVTGQKIDRIESNMPVTTGPSRLVCVSPAAAEKGPGLAVLDQRDQEECSVLNSTLEGGRFAYEMACKATASPEMIEIKAAGTFSSSEYTGTSRTKQIRGRTKIETRQTMSANRLGDC